MSVSGVSGSGGSPALPPANRVGGRYEDVIESGQDAPKDSIPPDQNPLAQAAAQTAAQVERRIGASPGPQVESSVPSPGPEEGEEEDAEVLEPSERSSHTFEDLKNEFPDLPEVQRGLEAIEQNAVLKAFCEKNLEYVKGYIERMVAHGTPVDVAHMTELKQVHEAIGRARRQSTEIPPTFGARVKSALTQFFSFGWLGIINTWIRGRTDAAVPLPDDAHVEYGAETDPQGRFGRLHRDEPSSSASGVVWRDEGENRATVHRPRETVRLLRQQGTQLNTSAVSSYMRYIQARELSLSPPSHFEWESRGMPQLQGRGVAQSPIHLLDASKVAQLQEAARLHPDQPALYVLPYVFPGFEDHIVNIVIDFRKKEIGFFDSKGTSIDDAQIRYLPHFSLAAELERIGTVCFGPNWDADAGIKSNTTRFQDDCNNCGRWVARQTECMTRSTDFEDCCRRMANESRGVSIGAFGERAASTLEEDFVPTVTGMLDSELKRLNPALDENLNLPLQAPQPPPEEPQGEEGEVNLLKGR